jgi:hypothetical protein
MNLLGPTGTRWLVIVASLAVTAAMILPPPNVTRLQLVVTPDAWKAGDDWLLTQPIKTFNDRHVQTADGSVIYVEPEDLDSGEAEDRISRQTLRPDIWIPASTMWGDLLNEDTHTSEELGAPDPPIIARSPRFSRYGQAR